MFPQVLPARPIMLPRKGSHVLNAMGLSPKEIEGAIRFSFSEFNTIEEMEYTAEKLKAAVQRFRRLGSFR